MRLLETPNGRERLPQRRRELHEGAGLVGAAMIGVSQILQAAVLEDYLTTRAAQQHFTSSAGTRRRQPA